MKKQDLCLKLSHNFWQLVFPIIQIEFFGYGNARYV